jgi:hypothetical protein
MKDGTMHLAYKAEQAVDLDTGVIVAINVCRAPWDVLRHYGCVWESYTGSGGTRA